MYMTPQLLKTAKAVDKTGCFQYRNNPFASDGVCVLLLMTYDNLKVKQVLLPYSRNNFDLL